MKLLNPKLKFTVTILGRVTSPEVQAHQSCRGRPSTPSQCLHGIGQWDNVSEDDIVIEIDTKVTKEYIIVAGSKVGIRIYKESLKKT